MAVAMHSRRRPIVRRCCCAAPTTTSRTDRPRRRRRRRPLRPSSERRRPPVPTTPTKGGGGRWRTAQAGEGVREGGAVRRRHAAVHVHPRGPDEDIAGQEQGHTEEHPPFVLSGGEDRRRRSERVREGAYVVSAIRRVGGIRPRGWCVLRAVFFCRRKHVSKPPPPGHHHCSRRSSRSWRGSRRSSTASHVRCRALP